MQFKKLSILFRARVLLFSCSYMEIKVINAGTHFNSNTFVYYICLKDALSESDYP